ncbi:hypothetical protein [Burkholderia ubonensis]|uniref:hypothetical protein n=1 Tax=Burkholderia ubonensis TaxID=101571 RepID=UPI00075A60D7|nr:hypothetical protein [Burkholderia ubonensis]KVD30714.1 hypothetical protein WI82_00365 [Burkholderia ubonensis]KWK85181.1 hypothetical protein WM17_08735 [Burkholderia ubonensis]KWK99264.1 hypothetical protein WM18_08420 [Burkholderia ubonensis]
MLVDEVHVLLLGLSAPWREAFKRHGLDLSDSTAPGETANRLRQPLPIDWDDPRIHDLCPSTERAIEPGDPARSLIYHMLALSECPSPDGGVRLEAIDLLENYIDSLAPLPPDWQTLDVAVLAYQYRPARRTGHQQHADLVFSRLGIARNGDVDARYDEQTRSFVPHAQDGIEHVRVMPARYGAFLVRRVVGPDTLALIEGKQAGDDQRTFIEPVRKLFPDECLPGRRLTLKYGHRHVGEKLKRAVEAPWGVRPSPPGDPDGAPYAVCSQDLGDATSAGPDAPAVMLKRSGAAVLLMPAARPLIEPVTPANFGVRGFGVPARWRLAPLANRRFTTMRIITSLWKLVLAAVDEVRQQYFPHFAPGWLRFPEPRNAPEFINIRHKAHENGTYTDMRAHPVDRQDFLAEVGKGGYRAQLFLDHCTEGVVTIQIAELAEHAVRPAYSVVAAPDFYPYADQAELQRWFTDRQIDPKSQFRSGSPISLSAERLAANPGHIDPFRKTQAFSPNDGTVAVAFSLAARATRRRDTEVHPPRMTSFLSDASSGVFAPGWDVTYAGNRRRTFLATFGLGSPFAEDIKLCAASNSFWPAVSPDASRTFNRADAPTAIPMLDHELGLHPCHPLVARGDESNTRRGWDGEYGPYLTPDGRVDYADIERSDYVANALHGEMLYGAFEHVDSAELIRRISALRHAVAACDNGQTPSHTKLWLVSARALREAGGADAPDDARRYRFLFVLPDDDAAPEQHTPGRLRVRYGQALRCDATKARVVGHVQRCAPGPDALGLY